MKFNDEAVYRGARRPKLGDMVLVNWSYKEPAIGLVVYVQGMCEVLMLGKVIELFDYEMCPLEEALP